MPFELYTKKNKNFDIGWLICCKQKTLNISGKNHKIALKNFSNFFCSNARLVSRQIEFHNYVDTKKQEQANG